MDALLWKYGRQVANGRSHPVAWELDFLRGMHQGPALATLANSLGQATGQAVRLMSVWMDKHAWVSWKDSVGDSVAKRELADLAVIVRKPHAGGIARWMWLIQGKRTLKLLDRYSGDSTPYEIDLMQRMPTFSLLGQTAQFDLTSEFPPSGRSAQSADWGGDTQMPWTFMDFDADMFAPSSAAAQGHSPIAPRWLGDTPVAANWADQWKTAHGAPDHSLSSYTECLCAIINGTASRWIDPSQPQGPGLDFVPGGPIDPVLFPVWSSLYAALLKNASNATSQHARTVLNPGASVLQVSQFMQSLHVNRLVRHLPRLHFGSNWLDGNHWRLIADAVNFPFFRGFQGDAQGLSLAYSQDFSETAVDNLYAFDQVSREEESVQHTDPPGAPPEGFSVWHDSGGGMLTLFVDVVEQGEGERA